MKLSELDPSEVSTQPQQPLSLSKLNPQDVSTTPPGFLQKAENMATNNLPAIGGIAGGLVGSMAGPVGSIGGAGLGGAGGQALQNYIKGNPQSLSQDATQGLMQAGGQALGMAAAPMLGKIAGAIADPVSDWFSDMAAEKAIEATGATGKQAIGFAPQAGKDLLDRGIVKFGNSQATVSNKLSSSLEKAGSDIGDTLKALDSKGATVDQVNIVNSIRQRAAELGNKPSQFNISDGLTRLADRLQGVLESQGGNTEVPLGAAESEKRMFFEQAKNKFGSYLDNSVAKEAGNIYRQSVEDAATKFDPESAGIFKEAKKTYALLNPIEEAASKRASTLAQSPKGGLLDTTTAVAGAAMGGGPGAVALPIARRMVADRIAPSMAAAANMGSKLAGSAPQFVQGVAPAGVQAIVPHYGLMAPPVSQAPQPPNFSTIPGKNGH